MTKQDAIETIRMALAQVEWEYPLDYAVAFDMAVEALNQPELVRCKDCGYWDRETVRQNSNDFKWWNEAVCKKHSIDGNEPHEMWTDSDWFCADGARR